MQIDPKVAAAAASATQAAPPTSVTSPGAHAAKDGTVIVNTPTGGALELLPGRQVVARVVEVGDTNSAKISLAGQTLSVQSDARLRVGDPVQPSIERADASQVRLAIVPPQQAAGSGAGGSGSGLPQGSGSAAQAVIGELAKAGVPVTPELAKAITAIANQLTGGAAPTAGTLIAGGPNAAAALAAVNSQLTDPSTLGAGGAQLGQGAAARALATLAGRDVALSPAAAGRVAAALDIAGSLGPSLASLAARSSAVAGALPSGPPSAESLRALLTPALEPAELAIARIVQASTPAASAAAGNGSSANSAAIRNYVSAQVSGSLALDQVTTATDQARATVAAPLPTASVSTSELEAGANASAARSGLAGAATQAALRGQAAAGVAGAASPTDIAAGRAGAAGAPPVLVLEDAPQAAAATAAQAPTAKPNATASAATGAANAVATPTSEQVAKAVADLGALAARVTTEAPMTGAVSGAAADAAKNANATQVAQNRGADGSTGAAAASNAGTAASGGGVAATVTALQQFLASPQSQGDAAKLMRAMQAAPQGALQDAIRQLPESQSLQLAGALLDQLPSSDSLAGARLAALRAGVHQALGDLGRALQPPADHDVATLRHVLHQVATGDPRPAVAHDAA
ncbi:MAG: hypothetical protein H7287_09420, partial [Thermoleophilia bacterium]|nr:hypothetical protein [Thermoleophilia bacterium]